MMNIIMGTIIMGTIIMGTIIMGTIIMGTIIMGTIITFGSLSSCIGRYSNLFFSHYCSFGS